MVLSLLIFSSISRAGTTTLRLKGLSKKAEIIVDKWGIPHIYAQTMEDLFLAQGFNAARDRLWQLDLWRRQGEGRLAEAFGPRFVDQDRAARLFLFRGDQEKEFKSYHPKGKEILTAFTRGINAYVDLTRTRPDLLPIEFKLTGATPGYWSPASPLIRIFGLTRNLSREVRLAQLVRLMGPAAVEKVSFFQPSTKLLLPNGLDLTLINESILKSYELARNGVSFRPEDLANNLSRFEQERYARLLSVPPIGQGDIPTEPLFESNNWAISGRLTSTGKPMLSGDPHRLQSVPSLRYIAHLVGPGWNVIGAGEPALPGISLGHNGRIAYAITIFPFADEEDLYVYDTNPQDSSQYLYQGHWENMRTFAEAIPVKGGASKTVPLKFTRHGPVLSEDLTHHKAYAVRAAYLEHEGTAPYLASLRLDQAGNWEEFGKGSEMYYMPSLNLVYADVDGNIGWSGCSLAPIRPNWNGMLPVPGNGDYEWKGFLEPQKLPRIANPKEGFFATANQYNLPKNYPFTGTSSHEWADPYRFRRIVEVLSSGRRLTPEDSARLQYDELSLPARELVPLLSGLNAVDPDVANALKILQKWDSVLSKDSVPAAIFELWVSQLHKNAYSLYVPTDALSLFGSGSRSALIGLLRSPDGAFGPNPIGGRDALLLRSLAQAVAILKTKLGADIAGWQWGRLHHIAYEHGLSPTADSSIRSFLNLGPLPVGGDEYTVHNTRYRESDFRQTHGATYREVMDLANWDRSLMLNSPGQSGDPNSPHYRDLFSLWVEGRFVPLLFSREKVKEAAEQIFVLQPSKREDRTAR